MTPPLLDAWAAYHVSETRHLDSQPTSTEPTFYPVTKTLLSAILKEGRLPFEVRANTSETKGKAHDMPDFVLGDDKMFVASVTWYKIQEFRNTKEMRNGNE